jgi:hypothetical protein
MEVLISSATLVSCSCIVLEERDKNINWTGNCILCGKEIWSPFPLLSSKPGDRAHWYGLVTSTYSSPDHILRLCREILHSGTWYPCSVLDLWKINIWYDELGKWARWKFKSESHYNRQSVGQSVLVWGAHLGPATNFFFLSFSFRQLLFVIL